MQIKLFSSLVVALSVFDADAAKIASNVKLLIEKNIFFQFAFYILLIRLKINSLLQIPYGCVKCMQEETC